MTYLILHLGPLTTLLQGLQEGLQLCSPFYFVVRTTNSPAGEILPCHFKAWRQKQDWGSNQVGPGKLSLHINPGI